MRAIPEGEATPTQDRLVAALVEYDGTEYAGFQLQKRGRTIQGELERGLEAIMARCVRVTPAGRTDAGVHARGQVVHLRISWQHGLADLRDAWNANLPRDIAVRAVMPVGQGFHARYSAQSRVYRYRIDNQPVRSPLLTRYAWHVRRPLSIEPMARACSTLLGRHDLGAFGRAPKGGNTVRNVLAARCWAEGTIVAIEVEADAFLQHMMRRLTATLVEVGLGRMPVEEFEAVTRVGGPPLVAGLAPPNGLCLLEVRYVAGVLEWPLPCSESWQKESCYE